MRYAENDYWLTEETMELLDDRVVITTVERKRPPKVSQQTVLLAGMQPAPALDATMHWPYRSQTKFWGILELIAFSIIVQVVNSLFGENAAEGFTYIVVMPLLVASIGMLYFMKEPLLHARFQDAHTKQVVLTITCRRKTRMQAYEQFVNAVSERIRQRGVA